MVIIAIMNPVRAIVPLIFLALLCAAPAGGKYFNDFEHTKAGPPPDDLQPLNGTFTVARSDGNTFLELAGNPVESDGMLFGPADHVAGLVGARIWATSSGRRFPEFGIGSNDVAGYKLWVLPGRARIELRHGDQVRAAESYRAWKSGTWTQLRLRVTKTSDGKWLIEAKAWPDGNQEPADWTLKATDDQAPAAGRASFWGTPYSGQPIRFDDLRYE